MAAFAIQIMSFLAFFCYYTVVSNALLVPRVTRQLVPSHVPNFHHIFNAIHSSMRQWGSSRNHNGMSFFLATVPRGTQFYHGTGTPSPVTVMEWLAFEPEHAMKFAIAFDPPLEPPLKQSRNPGDGEDSRAIAGLQSAKWLQAHEIAHVFPHYPTQRSLGETNTHPWSRLQLNITPGWLHTYQTKEDLHLLYIDGMAAAKSAKGTLDSQDYLLLKDLPSRGGFWDRKRAIDLCSLAHNAWSDRIDGFIRMEHGFEIIMCSFAKSLDLVRATRARPWNQDSDEFPLQNERDFISFLQAITARYHSIGGDRVRLNYDRFVSAFAYDGLDLFESPEAMPRLRNVSKALLDPVRVDIDKMILEDDPPGSLEMSSRWQSIADEIVTRYANRLQTLGSGKFSTLAEFKLEIWRLFRPFIDFDARDEAAEVERCIFQSIPPTPPGNGHGPSSGRRIVRLVSEDICTTLYATTKMDKIETAISTVKALMARLSWTVWKECPTCASDEVCLTPIWPYGSAEDYEHPRCFNSTDLYRRHGYWYD